MNMEILFVRDMIRTLVGFLAWLFQDLNIEYEQQNDIFRHQ